MTETAETVRTEIIPYLFYDDVAAAIDFLARAFGFGEELRVATPRGGIHAEMSLDGQRIMMGQGCAAMPMQSARAVATATDGVFVYLADVDAHHARAKAAGAAIERPPADESYGRTYTARDPEGHLWFFTTPPK